MHEKRLFYFWRCQQPGLRRNVTMAGQYEGGAIAISDAGGNVKVQLGVDGAGNGYVLVNGRMIQ